MQERGDLLQHIIELFRTEDRDERARIADHIATVAKAAVEIEPETAEIHPVRPADLSFLSGHPMPLSALEQPELDALNSLLPWGAMTTDKDGRVVGASWSRSKRTMVQKLVDSRIILFNKVLPLKGRHVLEVGCFEGIHTIGCAAHGERVTGVDIRMENVLKSLARLWAYGIKADVCVWDLEKGEPPATVPARWDILHHVGVLYHLSNPAEHLALALDRTTAGLLLDTHVATDLEDASGVYEALGRKFSYSHKDETPISPFAGVLDHDKWLLVEDLEWICKDRGFTDVRVQNIRDERNGKRVLLWAFKPGVAAAE